MKRIHLTLLCGSLAAALATGCQTVQTTEAGAVGVNRQQHMLVSAEEMNAGAEKAYAQLLAQAKQKNALDTDPAQVQRVQTIVKRLIPQTAAFRKDALAWKWEFHVLGSKEINAFCMPGGKIAVYSGLIQQLNATDEELAAVLGHEIAHALREHSREQASQQMAQQIGIQVIGGLAGLSGTAMDLSQMALNVTFNLPHSRQDEQEADRIGVELAARAGYDPRAAVSLWEKMQKNGGGQPPQWLSTHPSNEARIADVRVYADKVMPLYQQASAKR